MSLALHEGLEFCQKVNTEHLDLMPFIQLIHKAIWLVQDQVGPYPIVVGVAKQLPTFSFQPGAEK